MDVKIAGILDEITVAFFQAECTYLNLVCYKWKEQITTFQPDILFVESAWRGEKSSWYRKVSSPSKELKELIQWCKKRNVKTVFWNKEDPIHFVTFFETASLFDWVLTTDLDCIPLYKRLLHHNQVGLFLFSACTKLFHPVEQFHRKNRMCFAGAYYRRQKERTEDFEWIYETLKHVIPVDIYARNPHPGNSDYSYPQKYNNHIIGTLSIDNMKYAYKQYYFNLTINTVKYSSTMEARRVFELLASNTVTVSNGCQAIKNLFGDIVLYCSEKNEFIDSLTELQHKKELYYKRRLLGLRKVLSEHTFHHRMIYLLHKLNIKQVEQEKKEVLVFSDAISQEDITYIKQSFERQTYKEKKLVIVSSLLDVKRNDITVIKPNDIKVITDLGVASCYCYFSPENYYGSNYITDCILAKNYCNHKIIGKGCYFTHFFHHIRKKKKKKKYCVAKKVRTDRCIIDKTVANELTYQSFVTKRAYVKGYPCMLIDEYNFCERLKGERCFAVDDLQLDCGYSVKEIEAVAETVSGSDYYTIKEVLGPKAIFDSIVQNECARIQMEVTDSFIRICHNQGKMMSQTIPCSNCYNVSDYCIDHTLFLYYRGSETNFVCLMVQFIGGRKKKEVTCNLYEVIYRKIRVPVWAQSFRLFLQFRSSTSITINEICIDAIPKGSVCINDYRKKESK